MKTFTQPLLGRLAFGGLLFAVPFAPAFADACDGAQHCFDAGPFAAEVSSISPTWNNTHNRHYLRLNLRFRNTGATPIVLGFPWGSQATVTDNYGNAYTIDGNDRQNVSGIGLVGNREANANFVIPPGGSRTASLVFNRWTKNTPVGNVFTADFPVEQLGMIPGQQRVSVKGQFSLHFPGLSGGLAGPVNELGEGLGNVLKAFGHKR